MGLNGVTLNVEWKDWTQGWVRDHAITERTSPRGSKMVPIVIRLHFLNEEEPKCRPTTTFQHFCLYSWLLLNEEECFWWTTVFVISFYSNPESLNHIAQNVMANFRKQKFTLIFTLYKNTHYYNNIYSMCILFITSLYISYSYTTYINTYTWYLSHLYIIHLLVLVLMLSIKCSYLYIIEWNNKTIAV